MLHPGNSFWAGYARPVHSKKSRIQSDTGLLGTAIRNRTSTVSLPEDFKFYLIFVTALYDIPLMLIRYHIIYF